MALSPADFYSYSRATGAPVPQDAEERARMAPEVLAYRRNQLKAPQEQQQQGPDPLSVGLGIGLGLAGLGAAGLGVRRLFRGPKRAANAGVSQVDLSNWAGESAPVPNLLKNPIPEPSRRPPTAQEVPDPWGTPTTPRSETSQQESQGFTPRNYLESKGALPPVEDLTSIQQEELPQVISQKINAVESGEDQVTGRVLRRAQADTDFVKFSQNADDISRRANALRDISFQVNQFDEQLENLGLQNKQYQGSVNKPRLFTAEDLTGMVKDPTSGREIFVHQGGRRIGMTNAEIRDRVIAAASATPEQEQLLLNPDVPTSQVRNLLGTTGRSANALEEAFTNPTFEVRGSAATSPRATVSTSADLAQQFLEEQIGTGAVGFSASRQMMNPEYSARLTRFKDEWDKLSSEGIVAPRRSLVNGDEYTYQEMKQLVDQSGSEDEWDFYQRTGMVLRDLADSIGLSKVPQTITTLSQGPVLREVRTTRERTKTGTNPVVSQVEEATGFLPDSGRQERVSEVAVPLRATRRGEESTGIYAAQGVDKLVKQLKQAETILSTSNEWEEEAVNWAKNIVANKQQIEDAITKEDRPFRLVPSEVTKNRLVGGYQTNVKLPVFNFDTVRVSDSGQMVPMQNVQGTYSSYLNPIGRMQQLSNVKPARYYSGASETLDVQPFMLTNLVSQTVGGGKGKGAVQKQFVVNEPVYGQLLARTPEGKLSPVTLNKQEITGKVKQLAEQFANEEPIERGGLIANALHQDLVETNQLDLPVLKDPAAGRQFVNDLLNIEADVQQYGRPATGGVITRSKDLLRNQRFAAEYIKDQNRYAESVPLTTRRTYGLGGLNPMETEGGEFAAYAPRIETAPQRSTPGAGKPPPGEPGSSVSRSYSETPYIAATVASMTPASQGQLQQRNQFALTANLTPGGAVRRGALNLGQGLGIIDAGIGGLTESETIQRYGMTGSQLQQFGRTLMDRAAQRRGLPSGPTTIRTKASLPLADYQMFAFPDVPTQLSIPGLARLSPLPKSNEIDQIEAYLQKAQRGRSTPLTSEVRIQPSLF